MGTVLFNQMVLSGLYALEILGILSLLLRIINNNLHLLIIVKCTPCNVSSSSFIIMTSDDILITFCEQVNMQASTTTILVPEDKKKLIKIDPDVHKALNEVGLRGESFSDIIKRLIEEHRKREHNKEK
jgi:Putative antitoxin